MPIKIIADENIPFAKEAFGRIGEVQLLPGRGMSADQIKGADALVVRSVTKVNESLIGGSNIRFVGTATIGLDHVDLPYLEKKQIAFASAPGSNANSVGEYIATALLDLCAKRKEKLAGKTLGIIGVGNVGSRVEQRLGALGVNLLFNDPPKQRESGDPKYIPLGQILEASDIVTMHVPLTKEGEDATLAMANANFFDRMKEGSVYINSSRGSVMVESALKAAMASGKISDTILDVWENEPGINPDTVSKAYICTPHIAGYSYDGKVAGTMMMYEGLCQCFSISRDLKALDLLPVPDVPIIDISNQSGDDEALILTSASRVYDIKGDDRRLREAVSDRQNAAKKFDLLRKNYPKRREFGNTKVILSGDRPSLKAKLAGLGFKTEVK